MSRQQHGRDSVVTGSVEVSAGSIFEVPVVAYEGCILVWSFSTTGGDVGFGVGFKSEGAPAGAAKRSASSPRANGGAEDDDDSQSAQHDSGVQLKPDEEIVLSEVKRYESNVREIHGTIQVARQGTLTLKWDNAYSYFQGKTLKYSIELEEPLGGARGPRALGGPEAPRVVFVLGGPGAGKGTQCARLAKEFGFVHLSAGDLLRAERSDPASEHGALITQYIQEGKIVPVEITVALLWRAIRHSGRRFVLVDGFPRNKDNLEGWQRIVGGRAEVVCAVSFDVPDDVLVERLLERGKSSKRDDDNLESIKKRLVTFHEETKPIIWYFEQKESLVILDGTQSRDDVFAALCTALKARMGAGAQLPPLDDFILAAPRNRVPARVILGTMTFGGADGLREDQVKEMLKEFSEFDPGNDELDTARMYQKGDTERLLGKLVVNKKTRIASKVNPFPGYGETLSPTSVAAQLGETLAALKTDCIEILYLHAPDHNVPIEDTLEACDSFYRRGKFKELGMSNFAAWQVVNAYHICASRGWVRPTVYQGMYNAITRSVEKELFPALRALNIRFYAFNPLAGGLLTQKYVTLATAGSTATSAPAVEGRLTSESPMGAMYRDRYWKPSYLSALARLDAACKAFDTSLSDASLRWLAHHSMLRSKRDDGIIVGATSLKHLKDNMNAATRGGPLPLPLVVAFDQAWEACKDECPDYFR